MIGPGTGHNAVMAFDLPALDPEDPTLLELEGVEVRPERLEAPGEPLVDLLARYGLGADRAQIAADQPDGWRRVAQWPPRHAQDAALDFVAAPTADGWRVLQVIRHPDDRVDLRVGSHAARARPGTAARRVGLQLRWVPRPGHVPTPEDLGLALEMVNTGDRPWRSEPEDTLQAAAWFIDVDGTQLGEDGFAYRVDGSQAMPEVLEPGVAVRLPFSCDTGSVRGRRGPVGIYAWQISLRLRSPVHVLTFG